MSAVEIVVAAAIVYVLALTVAVLIDHTGHNPFRDRNHDGG